ncbi:chaperone modulator CbpM [Pedobacter frigidisoli]|uniref:chaperone modulator CbpM n=1 Tax=Pedobacter frigidisoli TaxID=2530455 RepID=UPI00292F51C3|nr:chaperone modulator CbpM [Pedobacter frigidisoli]
METQLIAIDEICAYHQVEIKFIESLEDFGLIQTTIVKKVTFLPVSELSKLERYIRLTHDLDINIEGLHAITQLLAQIGDVENEMIALKNELNYYKQMYRLD